MSCSLAMASRASSTRANTRVPLGDATSRANTVSTPQSAPRSKYVYMQPDEIVSSASVGATFGYSPSMDSSSPIHGSPVSPTPVASLAPPEYTHESKRNSAASSQASSDSRRYSSCDGFPNKKSHIGPWQLGKTLGKGSSARVRAARHCVTHQPVAVKIIAKKTARMTQSGSIAQLDMVDSNLPENVNGVRRMPLAIEREVAILKLIEHPNIVKLFDIWENRNEIYLIMEYVENGDLFTYISCNGALTEESSLYVFRQMMNAVQYCHNFNICHRDLKPENILLKSNGQIKIADFGMAALHQGPRYHLQTSCGSPHYAAPELLKARPYRGDKADIWSMGVILFVMLSGRLPFDEDDLSYMLAKAKKGIYTMPAYFSPEAKDLVHRILQVEPEVRISMPEMWEHPLVWKYGYLDDFGLNREDGRNADGRAMHSRPLDLANIDTQIFRQLHSMWHTLSEDDLAGKLVSNEKNDQKIFYWLLHGYRDRQLEDFNPTLTHSMSDYHHVNQVFSKKVSTRQFSQANASGHKRSVSRFTVISNIAETEADTEYGTIKSYDPYKASIIMRPSETRASHAKIVIHRNNTNAEAEVRSIVQAETQRARAESLAKKRGQVQHRRGTSASLQASRPSMNSIRSLRSTRSNGRHGTPGVRPAQRYKRGVDFSRVRKPSVQEQNQNQSRSLSMSTSMASVKAIKAQDESTLLWNEDLSEFSYKIAKDLDEAFMSSFLTADIAENAEGRNSPFSLRLNSPDLDSVTWPLPPQGTPADAATASSPKSTESRPWDSRPLPPSPPRSDSVQLEIERAQAERARKSSADAGESKHVNSTPAEVVSADLGLHFDAAILPAPLSIDTRRTVSAPVYTHGPHALPSIHEGRMETEYSDEKEKEKKEKEKTRAVSEPSKNQGLSDLAKVENTIRVVVSPTAARTQKPIAAAQTLDVQKNTSRVKTTAPQQRSRLRNELARRQSTILEDASEAAAELNTAPTRRSWLFRRQSKLETRSDSEKTNAAEVASSQASRLSETPTISPDNPPQDLSKKKGRLFPFWKNSKSNTKPTDFDVKLEHKTSDLERTKSRPVKTALPNGKPKKRRGRSEMPTDWYDEEEDHGGRKIEPRQTWLSRLFHVKPARQHLCLSVSQRRARQEIVTLLREWQQFGIRDIEVDKVNNIIFARVAAINYLEIQQVSFACEIITVIEHRKSNHLCIVRMTQEKGSASSFHRVAEILRLNMLDRKLMVLDTRKAKMMVKTLNS